MCRISDEDGAVANVGVGMCEAEREGGDGSGRDRGDCWGKDRLFGSVRSVGGMDCEEGDNVL